MELNAATIGALVVAAIVLAVAAIILGMIVWQGQRRVREAYRAFSLGSSDDVLTLLQRHVDEVRGLRDDVARQQEYGDALRALIAGGLSRAATVRYDAFDDMGGRMSFSTALLDEHGDGVVMTSINGRVETRTYAKTVTAGQSPHNLSEEEAQAIRVARSREGRTNDELATSGPRGRAVRPGRVAVARNAEPTSR